MAILIDQRCLLHFLPLQSLEAAKVKTISETASWCHPKKQVLVNIFSIHSSLPGPCEPGLRQAKSENPSYTKEMGQSG